MGLTSITGIFSRFFVVGFYLPSFFASFAVYLIYDDDPQESKVLAWPVIEANLTPREQELHADALANVHFFQNMCLGALGVAIALIVAAFDEPVGGLGWSLLITAGCLVLAWLFYRGAVGAVATWGENKIVAAVTHRRTLYALMGYKEPATFDEDVAIGADASRILCGDQHWPDEQLRRAE